MTVQIPADCKLPARVVAVIDKMNHGQKLVKSYRNKTSGETEIEFYYEPSGRRCGPKSAEAAIATGLLAPRRRWAIRRGVVADMGGAMTTTLTQQAAAIEATRRILKGGKVKPRGNELELLDQQLADASRTARMFAAHEAAIRDLIKATAA